MDRIGVRKHENGLLEDQLEKKLREKNILRIFSAKEKVEVEGEVARTEGQRAERWPTAR